MRYITPHDVNCQVFAGTVPQLPQAPLRKTFAGMQEIMYPSMGTGRPTVLYPKKQDI